MSNYWHGVGYFVGVWDRDQHGAFSYQIPPAPDGTSKNPDDRPPDNERVPILNETDSTHHPDHSDYPIRSTTESCEVSQAWGRSPEEPPSLIDPDFGSVLNIDIYTGEENIYTRQESEDESETENSLPSEMDIASDSSKSSRRPEVGEVQAIEELYWNPDRTASPTPSASYSAMKQIIKRRKAISSTLERRSKGNAKEKKARPKRKRAKKAGDAASSKDSIEAPIPKSQKIVFLQDSLELRPNDVSAPQKVESEVNQLTSAFETVKIGAAIRRSCSSCRARRIKCGLQCSAAGSVKVRYPQLIQPRAPCGCVLSKNELFSRNNSGPYNLLGLSGLVWCEVGLEQALWYPSTISKHSEETRDAVERFIKMKLKEPVKFQQILGAIKMEGIPIAFRLTRPILSCLTTNPAEDDSEEDPVLQEDKISKMRTVYFLLQLLTWRTAACRAGRESSISSSIIEASDSQEDTNDTSTSTNSGTMSSNTTLLEPDTNRTDKGKRPLNEKNGNDGKDDDDDQRPRKRLKRGPLHIRSLGGRLACPFAKAEPAQFKSCITIGRKDLSGIKEHLRRNHYDKRSPKGLLAARTWNEVFDFCNPNWAPRPRPSPNLDIVELFINFLRRNEPLPPGVQLNDVLDDYQRIRDKSQESATTSVNVVGHLRILPPTAPEEAILQDQAEATIPRISLLNMTSHSVEDRASGNSHTQPASTSDFNHSGQATEYIIGLPPDLPAEYSDIEPSSSFQSTSFDIENFTQKLRYNADFGTRYEASNVNSDISETLGAFIKGTMAPHLVWPPPENTQYQLEQASSYLNEELDIDINLPPEDLYISTMSSMDPNGHFFEPMTGYTMPTELPMPYSLTSSTFPNPNQIIRETQTQREVRPLTIVFPNEPPINQLVTPSNPGPSNYLKPPLPCLKQAPSETANKKYLLLVSRKPAKQNSTERKGHKRFNFKDFTEFRENFENWLAFSFTDPQFDWTTMEFQNDNLDIRLESTEEVIDDLEFSFTHYRCTKASLFLVMKEKGKGKAVE